MSLQAIDTALNTVAKLFNQLRAGVSYTTTNSYMDVNKLLRVEPLVALSRDLVPHQEVTNNLMPVLLNMFAGYYLLSINALTKMSNVEVIRILDKLNPDRDEKAWLLQNESYNVTQYLNNYDYRLPSAKLGLSMEAKSTVEMVSEVSNLCVGKLIEAEIELPTRNDDGDVTGTTTTKLPLNVRLLVKPTGVDTMAHIGTSSKDSGLVERYHQWRAGEIDMFRDIIMCRDLVRERRRAMMNDESGVMHEILRRVSNSKKYGLLTRNPSMATMSSIFVFSEASIKEVERKLGGTMEKSKRVRDQVFDSTFAIMIAVVDRNYETVTVYTEGCNDSSTLSWSQLKQQGGQAKGPDIADIMRALQNNQAPSF